MLNRGCVSVSVKPTQRGHRPEVETVPESDYYAIDNRAVCHIPHCGRLRIERDWMHNDNTIHTKAHRIGFIGVWSVSRRGDIYI